GRHRGDPGRCGGAGKELEGPPPRRPPMVVESACAARRLPARARRVARAFPTEPRPMTRSRPRSTSPIPIATIGYQATTVPAFLHSLTQEGVELLVDVRAVASSRRPGFSKTALAANLASVGIDYLHLRGLG